MPDSARFQIRRCTRDSCGLRFSILSDDPRGSRCPICRAPTEAVMLDERQDNFGRLAVAAEFNRPSGPELEVLFDNIRSAWNVGSMLRTADGAGVRRAHLCGVSAPADNPKVTKTALGAESNIPWAFYPDGVLAAQMLKEQGMRLWALEGGPRAESLFDLTTELPGAPMVLVAGNELSGVDPGILDLCERVVCLPMMGVKGSLNVAVAFGIAVYQIRFGGR